MPDQTKVPEAVLEKFLETFFPLGNPPFLAESGGLIDQALTAALTQFCEELLGEEAMDAAVQAIMGEQQKRPLEQVAIQAAIDSVMEGEDG